MQGAAADGEAKVLLIASNFPPVRGGSASVYANLARHMPGRIIVLAPRRDYTDGLPLIGWREFDRAAPYRTLRIPLLRTILHHPTELPRRLAFRLSDVWIRLRLLAWVARTILRDRVRVVCIGELIACGWLLTICKLIPGIRTATYVHGEELTTIDNPVVAQRTRRQLGRSDKVIVGSVFTQKVTQGFMGAQADRIVLIPYGVDAGRFRPGPKSKELIESLGLADRFVFVSVCRLMEKKGIDHTIMAFASLLRRHPDCRLVVVGGGPYQEALKALAQSMGLDAAVTFVGLVPEDELLSYYHIGDVFVMPNRLMPDGDTEGFGLVFLEANGCGLPVIAGRDGGSIEAVEDGYNGLVVDGHSVQQVEAALLRMREDAALRAALSENGLQRARQSDWNARARQFMAACGLP